MKRLDPANMTLSGLLGAAAVLLCLLMRAPGVDAVLPLVIETHAAPIDHLDQARVGVERSTVWVDRLDLAHDGQLRHPVLGRIGPAEQFFIDLRVELRVPEARVIHFEVESDDGFALALNERRICAFTAQRGLSAQRCRVLLEAGEHALHLSYFQAGGPAGLRLRHATSEDGPWALLGEDTTWLRVIREPR
jgi:hypothetical protein